MFLMDDGTTEVAWPVYNTTGQEYLQFKAPMSADSVKERLLPERTSLYTSILPPFLDSLKTPSDGGGGGEEVECDGRFNKQVLFRKTITMLGINSNKTS